MKKLIAVMLVLLMALAAIPALAEDDATVTAVGTASVTVVPDQASFTVGVSTQETQVQSAQATNAAAMNQVIEALKAQGVAAEDMQTQNYSVNAVYDYQYGKLGEQQTLVGYSVSNTVTVTVRVLDSIPALMDAAVTAGANLIYGISFESSASDAAADQALAAAAQDALRKAKLLAEALGQTAGEVVSLAEANDVYTAYSSRSMAYDAGAATPIEAGTLTVTATVRIEVALK